MRITCAHAQLDAQTSWMRRLTSRLGGSDCASETDYLTTKQLAKRIPLPENPFFASIQGDVIRSSFIGCLRAVAMTIHRSSGRVRRESPEFVGKKERLTLVYQLISIRRQLS